MRVVVTGSFRPIGAITPRSTTPDADRALHRRLAGHATTFRSSLPKRVPKEGVWPDDGDRLISTLQRHR
jgi:hypothetical protein